MEILFKSPAQPEERLLHDALAENRSETLSVLLSAICDTIFTTPFLSNKSLLSSLKALEILESRFRLELTNIDFDRSLTLKEQYIIHDASKGLYTKDDIEGVFYKHGEYEGIIALILYFRESQNIEKQWANINEGFRAWFVRRVTEMLSSEIVEWIPKFRSAQGRLDPHSLQYLGSHAGRKRKRHTSEVEGTPGAIQALSSPSRSNSQIRRAVSPLPQNRQNLQFHPPLNPKDQQHRQLSNTSSKEDGAGNPHQHQDVPTPTSNISSSEQNPPQQQPYRKPSNTSSDQNVTSTPRQYIPTLGSNVSSLCDNEPPSSIFLFPSADLISSSSGGTNLPINPLPVLIYSLGCSKIQQDILFRGLLMQKRWDDCGNGHEITPRDAGFNEQITCLFSSQSELEQTIELCIQLGLIEQGVLEDGSLVYSISNQSRHQISQSFQREELHLLGLMFIAHIYPRDQALESSFQDTGKLLLPYLERTWEYVLGEARPTLPAYIRDSLVEASLATYTFVGKARTKDMMSVLAKIQDPELPDYLRMEIANRESILLRFKGDHDQSDVVIQDILGSIDTDWKDLRSYCAYGRLLLSRTENAILRKEFTKAKSYLESWEVKNPKSEPSLLELQLVRLKNTVFGRVSRYEGDFPHSRHCLERCLETIRSDASRYHVMHHLGDVYCELGMLKEVEKLVLHEIEQLRARDKQHSKAFRRLALPLAEAYIRQGTFDAAKAVLQELLVIFGGMVNHDVADQLGHVRLLISLARVSWSQARWSEARQTLEKAFVLTENYRTFSKRNYYKGVINLFLSLVNFELHKYPEGRLNLAFANDIFREETPRHFMPGMGSYFLQDLLRIERSLQWPCGSVNELQLPAAFDTALMI